MIAHRCALLPALLALATLTGPGLIGIAGATAPKLMSPAEIQALAGDSAAWSALQGRCEADLDRMLGPGYVGGDWYDSVVEYGTCYNVAKHLGLDAGTVQRYAKKTLALMRLLARDQAYGTPDPSQELLALGDGTTRSFTLRMPPAAGWPVKVYLTTLSELPMSFDGTTMSLSWFHPVLRVSDTSGGSADYARGADYQVGYYKLYWLSSHHPATGATFYAGVANQAFVEQPAGAVTVSGTTLTLTSAPSTNQAVYVSYMGPDYQQTGNGMGGLESIKPDSAFPMRFMNVGLAWGFDLMRESTELTPSLRGEYATLLAQEVDYYENTTGANPYLNEPLGNYYIRGQLMGALSTAFAIDEDRATTPEGRELKPLARTLIRGPFDQLDRFIPGGYGYEGTYTNGTTSDLVRVFSIWKNATAADGAPEDLAAQLQWTANFLPATIHATKPDRDATHTNTDGGQQRGTFYDAGDWNALPAAPLVPAVQGFLRYQGDHPMAPFARQWLADLGVTVSGPTKDYKSGAEAFPLSHVTAGTGALYARSDWSTSAVWLSLAVGPAFVLGHQHLDRGNVTLQRGADYLLKDAGEYGAWVTLPMHNTLGYDDRGAGDLIVYADPPCQWTNTDPPTPPRFLEAGEFVYAQEDLTPSYGRDGNNAVTRAVRTIVYLRPDVLLVHDQSQTANPATKKYLGWNFGGPVTRNGSVFSAAAGQSKLFMRSLVPSSPAPTMLAEGTEVSTYNGSYALNGTHYEIMTTGQAEDSFLHVFQATASTAAQMVASSYVQSEDSRAQGAAVDSGAKRWVLLSATKDAQLPGVLAYALPTTCPCSHVVGDLLASTSYGVEVFDGAGISLQTLTVATGAQAVLHFETASASAARVVLTPGGSVVDTTAPTVSLTSPAAGATLSGPTTLGATASDSGSGVTSVQFLVDGAPRGQDSSAPYTLSVDTRQLSNGTHLFTARAFDGAGNSSESNAVSATVSNVADTLAPAAPTQLRVR